MSEGSFLASMLAGVASVLIALVACKDGCTTRACRRAAAAKSDMSVKEDSEGLKLKLSVHVGIGVNNHKLVLQARCEQVRAFLSLLPSVS